MTALEWANAHENVIIRIAGNGCPAGQDIALLPETEFPFDLEQVEGEVNIAGDFTATNVCVDGMWQFYDWKANLIYAIWLREDATRWKAEYDDWMGGTL